MGRKNKKTPKSYNVWIKQIFFGENQGQPTPWPIQKLIHVSLVESPTEIEENCIFKAFKTKIYHRLI
jgi:hypothetical protein